VRFTNGVTATDVAGVRTDVTVDNTVVAFLTGAQTLDQKTLTNSGNVGLANGSTLAVGSGTNTLTTQTAASISTGDGLTTGKAVAVDTGASTFSTGSGTGFTCASACGTGAAGFNSLDSLTGAFGVRSTGAFTGTLFALTADQTTAGTVLGISANKLTSGKAIDVQLGALYSGTGAINVRAEAYTGTILNVTSNSLAAAATQKLANVSSPQIGGTLLNVSDTGAYAGTGVVSVDANAATNATIVNVSATGLSNPAAKALSITTGTAGTGIFVNTQAAYVGNLIDLQASGSSQFSVTQTGATTVGGTLAVHGASITGPIAGAFTIDNGNPSAINIGGSTAATLNLGKSGQIQALLGNVTVAGTLTGQTGGAFTIDNGIPSAINIGGSTAATLNLGKSGQIQALLGNVTVAGTLTGPMATVFTIDNGNASAINIGGSTAATLNLGKSGQTQALLGNVTVAGTLTGPTAGAFTIDNGNPSAINIGGSTAATLNLGMSGQIQALLGNVTIAGTLGVTGGTTLSSTLGVTGPTTLSSTLGVTGATTLSSTLVVTGASTLNGGLTVTGGNANLGTTSSGPVHIETRQTTAPAVAVGSGAGAGGSCTLGANSTDTKGFVTIVTAGTKTASAAMCTITFNTAFGNAPSGHITPGNAATASLTNTTGNPFVTTTTTTLVITANTATVANSTYIYFYVAID
jgi:hypothetical protein